MQKQDIRINIITILIISISVINWILKKDYNTLLSVINPLFWSILFYIYFFIMQSPLYISVSNRLRKYIWVISIVLIYLTFYFLSGTLLGYANNPYSKNIVKYFINFLNYIMVIFFHEYIRTILIKYNRKSIFNYITIIILFVMVDVDLFSIPIFDFKSFIIYFSSTLMPIIITSTVSTYLIYKGGYLLALIFRIPMSLSYIYFPIQPKMGWEIYVLLQILLLLVILWKVEEIDNKGHSVIYKKKSRIPHTLTNVLLFAFFISVICFTSGMLDYFPISLLSNSMADTLNRGDMVIVRKVNWNTLIKDNDIIVYKSDSNIIVHRVIRINTNSQGERFYYTKGDSNQYPDDYIISHEQIIGIVSFNIPLIGYPSILLNEAFN